MTLTVVIPAYRAAGTIRTALDSVRNSSVPSQAIVVEDGVFDELRAVVEGYPEVSLVSQANGGAASARNTGLAGVSSEYCFFLDSDDYVGGVLFENLLKVIELSAADIAFGPWCFVYDGRPHADVKYPVLRSNEDIVAAWLRNECYPPCCVMWRTASLRRIGGWDPSFRHNDDAELVIRAMMSGFSLAVANEGCGYYVQHDSPDRVSKAATGVASEAADRIFQMVSAWERDRSHGALREALTFFAYEQSRRAYRSNESALGSMWLSRARALGLRGHLGTPSHRFMARIFGLGAKERLASLRDLVPVLRHRYR